MSNELNLLSGVVVEALRGDDNITVGQLRAVLGTDLGASLGAMTMAEFLGAATKAAPKAKSKAKAKSKDEKGVNVRTPEARAKYDAKVLDFVKKNGKGDGVGAADVRKACGGTSLQARTALNRLIDDGKLTWKGKARATVYMPAS